MNEAVLTGCVLGTESANTEKGCFSPVTSSGDSVPKSFGKGKSLGGKSIGCAALRASAKKDGNDPSMWVS